MIKWLLHTSIDIDTISRTATKDRYCAFQPVLFLQIQQYMNIMINVNCFLISSTIVFFIQPTIELYIYMILRRPYEDMRSVAKMVFGGTKVALRFFTLSHKQ